ncbi:uncharacterized protein K441DRAFT_718252, partial [Cenococcum geophilum 1.58]|uniref:uncharacterized protein n=1 Tax=Cenococcum geophilum 1.58 TaxID=794803 RepID=UPI00358ECDD7
QFSTGGSCPSALYSYSSYSRARPPWLEYPSYHTNALYPERLSKGIVEQWLPSPIAIDIARTLRGGEAQATNSASFQKDLLNTKAAENAREERRKRKRRVVTAGGGPVYAGEAREMSKKRKVDEIQALDRQSARLKARERQKVFTRWAKLRPTVRNHGKIYGRRQLKDEPRRRDVSKWLKDDYIELQDRCWESIKRAGPYGPRIKAWPTTKDTTPAADVAAQHQASDDPYELLLRQKWTAEALASAPIVIKDDSDSGENASGELNTSSASFGSDKLRDYKRFGSDELLGDERIL